MDPAGVLRPEVCGLGLVQLLGTVWIRGDRTGRGLGGAPFWWLCSC